MPSNQSGLPVYGARPARHTTPVTRSGISAAQASAGGPPPDAPMTAKRSSPSASAICATSPAAEATSRPGCGVEPP